MMEERPKFSLLEDLQDLDRKLIKLIARRAEILQKLSANRHKSPRAASRYAGEERELRKNWEQAASRVSRDEQFLRRAFSLLQEITLIPDHLEERRESLYNLAPPRKPVQIETQALTSLRQGLLWVAIAAGQGATMELTSQALSDPLIELIKALNQAGAHLSWEMQGTGLVISRGGEPLIFADKTIFSGNSDFNFYLISSLALNKPGVVKFTGDSALKLHDFSAWRNAMPMFGARLAHVIPKSRGLPVHLECSGMIPREVSLPDDLSAEAVLSLMIASSTWSDKIRFLNNGTSAFQLARTEASELFNTSGTGFTTAESFIDITPGERKINLCPSVPIDLQFAFLLLGLAIMSGGKTSLKGVWPEFLPYFNSLENLLTWAGASFKRNGQDFLVDGNEAEPSKSPMWIDNMPSWVFPLTLTFGARLAATKKYKPQFGFRGTLEAGFNLEIARDFLQLIGAGLEEVGQNLWQIISSQSVSEEAKLWTAPTPDWCLAAALGAYLTPNISLTNPAMLSKLFPSFWSLYNSLPQPNLTFTQRQQTIEEKPRRKVIAKGAVSNLSELRADYEPQNQNSDE